MLPLQDLAHHTYSSYSYQLWTAPVQGRHLSKAESLVGWSWLRDTSRRWTVACHAGIFFDRRKSLVTILVLLGVGRSAHTLDRVFRHASELSADLFPNTPGLQASWTATARIDDVQLREKNL